MSTWSPENSVVTNLGSALLSQARIGLGTIKLTRVVARENFEASISNARTYTLSDITEQSIAQEGYIMDISVAKYPDPEEDIETSLMTVRFSNDDLEDSEATYNLRQIVVLASIVNTNTEEESEEVPYMVCQCDSSSDCDVMPARSLNPTSFDYDIYVLHAGVEEVNISVRTEGYVWQEDFDNYKTEVLASLEELGESLQDKFAGINATNETFTSWTPTYDSTHEVWGKEASSEVTGGEGAERFNIHNSLPDPNIASGVNSSAFGTRTEALAENSFVTGEDNYNNSENSFVSGMRNSIDSGHSNAVFGTTNELKESVGSFVTGASNLVDTRVNFSLTAGECLINRSANSLVCGKYNDPTDIPSLYALIVGGGNSNDNRTNLMTLTWTGVLEVPTIKATHILNSDGSEWTPEVNLSYIDSGEGAKSIVANNIAMNKAVGMYSSAFGTRTEALGTASFAVGSKNKAIGTYSVAMGESCVSQGDNSFVGGYSSNSASNNSFIHAYECSIGNKCDYSTIIGGRGNTVSTVSSQQSDLGYYTILGSSYVTIENSIGSTIIGSSNTEISGGGYNTVLSTLGIVHINDSALCLVSGGESDIDIANSEQVYAFGDYIGVDYAECCFLLGSNLKVYGTSNSKIENQVVLGTYNENDPEKILIVGCGTSEEDRKNAFSVSKEGNIYLNDDTKPLGVHISEITSALLELTDVCSKDREALSKIIDEGPKNKINFSNMTMIKSQNTGGTWDNNVFTHNSGVTFTVNDDFSITVNGTATGSNAVLVLSPTGGLTLEEGNWVLSGCPEGGNTTTYNISIAGTASDIGNSAEFNSVSSKLVRIYVLNGVTVDNLTFKPMVCSKTEWNISKKYVPYRPSYDEVIARLIALENAT